MGGPGSGGRHVPSAATRTLHENGWTARDVARLANAPANRGGKVLSGGERPRDTEPWCRALRALLPASDAERIITDLGLESA